MDVCGPPIPQTNQPNNNNNNNNNNRHKQHITCLPYRKWKSAEPSLPKQEQEQQHGNNQHMDQTVFSAETKVHWLALSSDSAQKQQHTTRAKLLKIIIFKGGRGGGGGGGREVEGRGTSAK